MFGLLPLSTKALSELDEAGAATGSGSPTKTLSASAVGVATHTGTGTTYFVKNGGNNAANGLSDATAWATVAKVNSVVFASGDTVRFKRGSLWRETLVPRAGVTYRDYDAGALPILSSSNLAAGWVLHSGNVWRITLGTDPNMVWFNGTRGTERTSVAALVGANEWFFDGAASRLYVWSTTDPTSAFTAPGVEYATRDYAINNNGKSNTIFQFLALKHGRGSSEGEGQMWISSSANVVVEDCEFTEGFDSGITIAINLTVTNLRIDRCTFTGHGLCGINGPGSCGPVTIRYNTANENGWRHPPVYGSGMLVRATSGTISDNTCLRNGIGTAGVGTHHGIYIPGDYAGVVGAGVVVENNICGEQPNGTGINATGASCIIRNNLVYDNAFNGIAVHDPTIGTGVILVHHNTILTGSSSFVGLRVFGDNSGPLTVRAYHNTCTGPDGWPFLVDVDVDELDIRNNIFHRVEAGSQVISVTTQTGVVTFENNLYYRVDLTGNPVLYGGVSRTWATWQSTFGHEANGIWEEDPDFRDAGNDDYTLLATSPAIDAGLVLAGINDGYLGPAPDLGAFESGGAAGAATKTLSVSAAGVAVQRFNASGTPTKTLSASAAGAAALKFTGSGAPSKTLSVSAVGAAVNADFILSGAPVVTLSPSATGTAEVTNTQDAFVASGAPIVTLVASAAGVAVQKFNASGTPTKTLSKSAVGVAEQQVFQGPFWTGQSGTGGATTNRVVAWPGSNADIDISTVEVDDIALLWVVTANEIVPSITATGAGTPTNFQRVDEASDGGGSGTAGAATSTKSVLYWARATSHHMSSVNVADPGNHVVTAIATFRNCIPTGNPWDVIALTVVNPASTSLNIPGDTTTVDDCLIVGSATNATDTNQSQVSGIANADLATVTEIIDFNSNVGGGSGVTIVTGEKRTAGAFGAFTGTFANSTRSIGVSIALKPPLTPLVPSIGTGAPTKTLSASAVGVAVQRFNAAGAATKTLSVSAAGIAGNIISGSGAPIKTLSVSAVGVATRALDITVTDGNVETTLVATAHGLAFSEGVPTEVPRPPRRAAGGGGARRKIFVRPDEPEAPKKRRKQPAPPARPTPEAAPLPALAPLDLAPLLARVFDPMAWQALTAPSRVEIPVRPQWEIDEEEAFLKHILEVI
jgi:hypothetical protein